MNIDLTLTATVMELVLTPNEGPELVLEIQSGVELVMQADAFQGPPGPAEMLWSSTNW
jgi:hypothetical protein